MEQPLTIDLAAWSVRVGDRGVHLTYREFRMLLYLVSRAGEVVSRAELSAAAGQSQRRTSSRTADTSVARLRKKLGAAGWDAIRTVRKLGYRCEGLPPNAVRIIRLRSNQSLPNDIAADTLLGPRLAEYVQPERSEAGRDEQNGMSGAATRLY